MFSELAEVMQRIRDYYATWPRRVMEEAQANYQAALRAPIDAMRRVAK